MFQADFGKKGAPDEMQKDLAKMFKQIQVEVDKTPPPQAGIPSRPRPSTSSRRPPRI